MTETIKRCKKRKAPGPDEVPMEFFKYLNDEAIEHVRELINNWWCNGIFPEEKLVANIACIYKKGSPLKRSNYRPISLLNAIYKIYAALIQKRLADAIDDDIQSTQFGFRKNKSTSTAIACI